MTNKIKVPQVNTSLDATWQARAKRFIRKNWIGYAFLAPFVILFTIFIVAPVLTAIGLSFTDFNMMQTPHFVGVNNYKLLFLDDEVFITALSNTIKFAVITGPIGYLLSFFAAWVINQLKFKRFFALAFMHLRSPRALRCQRSGWLHSPATDSVISTISCLTTDLLTNRYCGTRILPTSWAL